MLPYPELSTTISFLWNFWKSRFENKHLHGGPCIPDVSPWCGHDHTDILFNLSQTFTVFMFIYTCQHIVSEQFQ